jgi:hypothetical protein
VKYVDTTSRDPNSLLESNVLHVEVVPAPGHEHDAQAAYTPDLAYVAQYTWGGAVLSPEREQAAADFIQQFPDSRYTVSVKNGLESWLDLQNRAPGHATAAEQALWEKLFAHLDRTAPFLDLWARPFRIWPPNHQLVPVIISVQARDDQDPHPVVKLVSVTCNDHCDVNRDIVGAVVDADVRELELRAEVSQPEQGHEDNKSGGGDGRRVYTITYSAEDASGNKRVSTTSVCVAPGDPNQHCDRDDDRRRGKKRDSNPDGQQDHGDTHDQDHGHL